MLNSGIVDCKLDQQEMKDKSAEIVQDKNGTLIIAGASKGIGRHLAFSSLAKGFPVALLARSGDALKQIIREI